MQKELIVTKYNDIRVLTTQQLAEAYGSNSDIITKNFNRNKDRYINGKHFICLQGEELKHFKTNGQIDLSTKVNKLYLWTKKGAFLHAKSLNTDQAWDVYDKLVDHYFETQKCLSDAPGGSQVSFKEVAEVIPMIANDLHVNSISRLIMYKGLCEDYKVPTGFLPDYVQGGDREKKPVTILLKEIGADIKAAAFNKLLIECGILEERDRKSTSSKSGVKHYKSLTKKGVEYGENLINPHNSKETQPYYYVDSFKKLYDTVMSMEVA